jgi:hypothetical protein
MEALQVATDDLLTTANGWRVSLDRLDALLGTGL